MELMVNGMEQLHPVVNFVSGPVYNVQLDTISVCSSTHTSYV